MILSHLIFPPRREDRLELYYRGMASVCNQGLRIQRGERVSFDTYFNAFFYRSYVEHGSLAEVTLRVAVSGKLRLALILAESGKKPLKLVEVYAQEGICALAIAQCLFVDLPANGAVYLLAEALSETAYLHSGCFEAEPVELNPVRVAAVICTYRREEYIRHNLERLCHEIWNRDDNPIREELDCFVVDNGQTISSLAGGTHAMLFPNRNYGGSGGFTRGLIEAWRRKDRYTHVLLMDDDISFEPESVFRTIQFLKMIRAKNRPVCVGGQMLLEDRPCLQYAAGSKYVNGSARICGENLDLVRVENLLENDLPSSAQFNAWWYCCFPLAVIGEIGLPLPLFIKTDDIEYGLRMKAELVLLNGIGVWHTPFSNKYSPHLEYYIKRNELIVSAIHDNGSGPGNSVYKLIRTAGKALIRGAPQLMEFALMGYRDYLKGPDFLLELDQERLNASLLEKLDKAGRKSAAAALKKPLRLFAMILDVWFHYKKAQAQYKKKVKTLSSLSFWCSHLDVPMVEQSPEQDDQ